MNRLKEKEILEAIKTGNNELVLGSLYKEILPRVKKFIIKNSGSEEDAKDVFQDTVFILYNHVKLNKFNENNEIGGFMYVVAKNLWINKAKRENRSIDVNELKERSGPVPDILQDIISEEKAIAIDGVLDQLGEECKKLLKYSIYDKLSMKEIAQKMGYLNEGIARTYTYRCRKKLINLVKANPHIILLFKE